MRIDKIMIIIVNILFYIGVIGLVLYFVAGFRYFNAKGSMIDNIDPRSVLVMNVIQAKDLKNEQVVAYENNKEINIYKIIGVSTSDVKITNNAETISAPKASIKYLYLFQIPFLGMVISFIMTKMGIITVVGLIVIYFVLKKFVFKK